MKNREPAKTSPHREPCFGNCQRAVVVRSLGAGEVGARVRQVGKTKVTFLTRNGRPRSSHHVYQWQIGDRQVLCSASMRAYKFLDAEFGLKSLRERRLKISTLHDLNDPFELLPYEMSDRNHRSALRETRNQMARNRGILCFSADWRDPVIWAHYSDKHRGLCLGFEIPDEKCSRVRYVVSRLPFPARLALADAEKLHSTKYINWKYEQEIRVWLH